MSRSEKKEKKRFRLFYLPDCRYTLTYYKRTHNVLNTLLEAVGWGDTENGKFWPFLDKYQAIDDSMCEEKNNERLKHLQCSAHSSRRIQPCVMETALVAMNSL